MSTKVYEFGPEGDVQAVSPDGQKVAFGNTTLQVVHVPNPAATWPLGTGRAPRFLDDDRVTWIQPITNTTAQRFVGDLRAFVPVPTKDNPALVAGNEFEASGGYWASALLDGTPPRRVAYDNRILATGCSSCRMAGRYLLTIRDDVTFEVYEDGILRWSTPKPAGANEFQLSSWGWITWGYYGPSWLITPDGQHHNLSIVPWGQEGPARLVHLPDGSTWAWTASNNRIGEAQVYGRPLIERDGRWVSDPQCVTLPEFPATSLLVGWWDNRASFTVAGSANLGHETPCQVHVVPVSMARAAVPDPAPTTLPDIAWTSDPVGTPFDILHMLRSSATAERDVVLWYRKGDPFNGDAVGAWLDYDRNGLDVGLLADTSTGQHTADGHVNAMWLEGPRLWMQTAGASGWSAEYDCAFVWRDGTRTTEHVRVGFESGYARFKGVDVFFRHLYDPRRQDPANPKRKAGFLEYSYYSLQREEVWDELQDDQNGVPQLKRRVQPVPFTGQESFVAAPRPQPYGPIRKSEPKPTITIRDYWPRTGTAPLTWQATAVTTGKVDSIVWRYRKQGAKAWTLKGDDAHTTITFTSPGTYEIGVDAFGPGGSDGTATPRLIVVTA